VIAAVAHQALGRLAGDGQGRRIQLAYTRQHLGHRAQVDLLPLMGRELDVIQLDAERVNECALHDAHETGDVVRQVGEQVAVLARVGHDTVLGIVFERVND
jgi:hypothetical protein